MEGQLTQVTPDNAAAAFASVTIDMPDTEDPQANGSVVVRIMPGVQNVQQSNFGDGSFIIENTGDKRIVGVYFDHATALYQDSVWDPDGTGGDSAFKELQIDSDDGTEVVAPTNDNFFQAVQELDGNGDPIDPLFQDGVAEGQADGGFRGLLLTFGADDTDPDIGFTNGEEVTFSGDMDPNSIAGFTKGTVDGGSSPQWDVGGVSGAELIGTTITIMFSDGTTATAQLMSDGSQGGSQALITQDSPETAVTLTVNGIASTASGALGGEGTYDETDPMVTVTGNAGDTVRVVLTKGHNPVQNPTNNAAQVVEDRLADEVFKANNAAEFQIQDVVIGADGTATVTFNYDDIDDSITQPFFGDNTLPLGFVAAVIDPSSGLPEGPVTAPIYLEWEGQDPAMPVANNDTAIVSEDDGAIEIDVLANDTDANGDILNIVSVNGSGATGQVTLNNGVVSYNPNGQFENLAAGESATDTFTYTINDGASGSASATVTVTVTGVNDNPDAVDDSAEVFANAGAIVINVLGNDSDIDGDGFTVSSVSGDGSQGDVSLVNGDVVYNPNGQFDSLAPGETATDSFTYTISDGQGGADTATVTITITGPEPDNSAPVAVDDAPAAIDEDAVQVEIDVLGNDSDPDDDALTVLSVNSTGAQGAVTIDAAGRVLYTPGAAFQGLNDGQTATDTFSYTVSDGRGGADTATVTVTISGTDEVPDNNAPIAVDDAPAAIGEDAGAIVIDVLGNDSDPDSDTLTVIGVDQSLTTGLVTLSGDGVVSYDPNGQFEGLDAGETTTDSFTYTVSDGQGGVSQATVTITITGADEPTTPVFTNGDDVVTGTAADDTFAGRDGDDQISGGDGADLITGGKGNDIINGDMGDDELRGNAGDDIVRGGAGDDEIFGGGGADALFGGDGDDLIVGVTGDDEIFGGEGNDNLFGRADNDTVNGGGGDDRLTGNSGDDSLLGGAGDDVMVGGGGDDSLTGGSGNDVFVFLNERGADVITDFQSGVDRISYANRSFGDREVEFTDLELIQNGDDTIVRERGLEVTLEGVSVGDLSQSDFVF